MHRHEISYMPKVKLNIDILAPAAIIVCYFIHVQHEHVHVQYEHVHVQYEHDTHN